MSTMSVMFMKQAPMTAQVKIGLRNRWSGTIGSAALPSIQMNAPMKTTPTASIATTSGASQPIVPPKLMPRRSAVTPMLMVEMPA
ncbi:MAG: hypothetical protein WAZ15_10365 [Propioniciclava sp.]|jgi:hypothetical protein